MDQARGARVWASVSACARREGAPVSLRHVVMACADEFEAAGAGLSLARDSSPREPVLASTAAAEELEELQFTLGEGPGIDAVAGRGPVLSPDLTQPAAQSRWPAFAPAAADRGVRGMFAFPVAAGAALVGVLDVYRLLPGALTGDELADGLVFADTALVMVLDERGGTAVDPDGLATSVVSTRRAQVHQATGMVAAQLGVHVSDALTTLRAHAFAQGRSLTDLAADILARRIRLDLDGARDSLRNFTLPDGSAGGGMRDDRHNSPQPGKEPGGRQGREKQG